jgi:hypothetical protein
MSNDCQTSDDNGAISLRNATIVSTHDGHATRRLKVLHNRITHGIYSLIILLAGVSVLAAECKGMASATVLVGGGALVLIVANLYSELVSEAAATSSCPQWTFWKEKLIDQISMAVPDAVAVLIFLLAWLDALDVDLAYKLVFAFAFLGLIASGFIIATSTWMGICLVFTNCVLGCVILVLWLIVAYLGGNAQCEKK